MPRLINLALAVGLIYGFAPAEFRETTMDYLTDGYRNSALLAPASTAPDGARIASAPQAAAAIPASATASAASESRNSQQWGLAARQARLALSDLVARASGLIAPRPRAEKTQAAAAEAAASPSI